MILGTGIDIVEIERIEKAASKQSFINRILTQNEKEYWERKGCAAQTLAGLFAAKEAVVKALGTGFGSIEFKDVEVLHTGEGMPTVKLRGGAAVMAEKLHMTHVLLSISHCKLYAVAQAILEAEKNE